MSKRTKVCARCKIEKPHGEFHINKSIPDGRNRYCKVCVSEVSRQRKLAKGETGVRSIARSHLPWAEWEHAYLAANPHLSPRLVASNLQRSTRAVNLARYRLRKKKDTGRN